MPALPLTHLLVGGALAVGLGVAGNAVADIAGLAVPGAVIGLLGLVALMALAPTLTCGASAVFDRVAPHMILLFVPAGSGIVSRAPDLADNWLAVGLAVLLGTPTVIAIVAISAQALLAGKWRTSEASR